MKYVGIAAYSGEPSPKLMEDAKHFIHMFARCCGNERVALVVGGYWGLMKVLVDEGLRLGLPVVIIPPIELENIKYPEGAVVIKSGTSYRMRSIILVRTCDVLVALGGAGGTFQEIVSAYDEGRPIFVLGGRGLPTDKVKQLAPYIDDRRTSKIFYTEAVDELVKEVCRELCLH
ncbi:MAG: LOG family protein [Sulfolobales archaeon]|nr:LOG family protein [Sulfolobales archaeon]MCX8185869.1 LOG family protein [Sulfolobales archaeon]MDW7969126.1 LOG family protein [Sulfolobales archaeon]